MDVVPATPANLGNGTSSPGPGEFAAQVYPAAEREAAGPRPERFQVGDKIDVRVTAIDAKTRKLGLSIKAREIAEEKEAVEQYGSSDSGASLGDILGAALKGKN